jgi:putative ABC transport system permease protein
MHAGHDEDPVRLLFGLSPRDPTTLVLVAAMLMAIAVIAGYLPARRAAGIEPITVLKAE